MNYKKPTSRVEMKNSGTPPNETYGWKIYRNRDVLLILRSQQLFVSRMAGSADANRSKVQPVDTERLGRLPQSNRTRFPGCLPTFEKLDRSLDQ